MYSPETQAKLELLRAESAAGTRELSDLSREAIALLREERISAAPKVKEPKVKKVKAPKLKKIIPSLIPIDDLLENLKGSLE